MFDYLALNGPSWSISTEFYAYLVFGLALVILRDRVLLFLTCVAIGGFCFLFFYSPSYMDTTYRYGFIRCIYGFSLGAILWTAMRALPASQDCFRRSATATCIEVAALVLVVVYVSLAGVGPLSVFAPVVFAITVFVFAQESGLVSSLLKKPPFLLLGLLSYSIYMNQVLISGKIFSGLTPIAERVLGISLFSVVDGAKRLGTSPWEGEAFNILFLLTLVAVSWFSYHLIERPGREFFGRLVRKKPRVDADHLAAA